MNITDAVSVAGTRLTDEGYLQANALSVRTGIQHYRASEVGLIGDDLIAVYRPASEVFARDSVASFARVPVTVDHPAEAVAAGNWRDLAVGETDSDIMRDGERLRIPMTIRSADAVQAVQDGKRELSAGYTCELEWQDGVTEDGTPYQAVQRNIRANHIAIVARGRAGSECRIGDGAAQWGAAPITMSDEKEAGMADALKTVVLGDEAVSVAVADAAKIDQWKAAQAKALADAEAAHDAAIATKDGELATKDAKITELEAKILSDADLDARVAARADLIGKAKALVADVDVAGKSDADIRKAVVVAKRGAAMADKSAAYIDAAFDLLTENADNPPDPVRGQLKDSKPIVTDTAQEDAAYAAYLADFNPQDKEAN